MRPPRFVAAALSPVGWLLRGRRADADKSVAKVPELAPPEWARPFTVTSTAFAEGQQIPERFCAHPRGDNASPPLTWTRPPAETKQLLLVVEDPDAPFHEPSIHMLALLDPTRTAVADGELTAKRTGPGIRLLKGRRELGYFGPLPLPGHGVHTYGFHLWALDTEIPETPEILDLAGVLPLVDGHILAHGVLHGTQKG